MFGSATLMPPETEKKELTTVQLKLLMKSKMLLLPTTYYQITPSASFAILMTSKELAKAIGTALTQLFMDHHMHTQLVAALLILPN